MDLSFYLQDPQMLYLERKDSPHESRKQSLSTIVLFPSRWRKLLVLHKLEDIFTRFRRRNTDWTTGPAGEIPRTAHQRVLGCIGSCDTYGRAPREGSLRAHWA